MKREVISEALNNISEEYRAEALEMHSLEVVSGPGNMKKKIVTIILAAAITAALGATAYAALTGMTSRNGEPEETLVNEIPAYTCDVTEEDEDGNQIQTTFYQDAQTLTYEDISKVFTFDGRESCNEIQFMASYLPEGYTVNWGPAGEWTDVAQGDYNMGERCYNIKVYYASQFGPDGSLFSQDVFDSEEVIEDGDFIIYKLSGTVYGSDIPVFFYLMYNTAEGYLIEIDSTESMEVCENIAAGLEIRTTGGVVNYDPNESHDIYLCTGIG
ncbi:hypothetical protein SAMN06296952_0779 [Oscillospiraceae bacterium]|nr:hypothetical protein SAMN06296952_0779 [Oscillospiraceae bacterium]